MLELIASSSKFVLIESSTFVDGITTTSCSSTTSTGSGCDIGISSLSSF